MSSSAAAHTLSAATRYTLRNSPHSPKTVTPALGFGVYLSPAGQCTKSVLAALQNGYRLIDTAQYYDNEADVGEAVRKSGIPREEVYICTKILFPKASVQETLESVRDSVRKIAGGKGKWEGGDGYVDYFLIHTPSSGPAGRKTLWEALEKLQEEGGTREIGVSNYGIKHLEEMFKYAKHKPVINQLELHPFCPQPELTQFCTKHDIILQAYSPLIRAKKMDEPTFVTIAKKHSVTVPQVLVRWSMQKGWVPLPKSDTPDRIKLNGDVYGFELTDDEMAKINALGKGFEDGQGALCPYNVHCP
ncbi:NADP-dependent oxidoreductase domain-containing protein [Peziza echinospora]|nr:NADP-dependent oxidoreductase domain-containing protein [Peziza echinospora]